MTQFKILFSDDAKSDLRDIYNYVAHTLLEPGVAKGQRNRIVKSIQNLRQMPERHPLYHEEPWRAMGLRKMLVDNYIVLYVPMPDSAELLILRVLYAGRNIRNVLKQNEFFS